MYSSELILIIHILNHLSWIKLPVSNRNLFLSASSWPFFGPQRPINAFLTFLTTFEGPYGPERGKKLKFLLAKPLCLGSNYSVSIRNPFVSASFWPFLGCKDHVMHFLTFLTTFEGPYVPERGKKLKFLLAKPLCLGSNYSVSIRNPFVSASFWPFLGCKDHVMHFLTFLTTFKVPYRPEGGEKLKFLLAKPFCLGSNYSVSIRNPFVSTSFWPFFGP